MASTAFVSYQHEAFFGPRATRLFPNVVVKNDFGSQFVASANLIAIMCTKLKNVILDAMEETDELTYILLSGYSHEMMVCLDKFLHEGVVNIIRQTREDCEQFCSELRHEFEEVLGVHVPHEFWDIKCQVKREVDLDAYESDSLSSYSFHEAEPVIEHSSNEMPSATPLLTNPDASKSDGTRRVLEPHDFLEIQCHVKSEAVSDVDAGERDPLSSLSFQDANSFVDNPCSEMDTLSSEEGASNISTLTPKRVKLQKLPTVEMGIYSYTQEDDNGYKGTMARRRVHFSCPICAVVIRRRDAWFAHIKENHPDEAEKYEVMKEHQCPDCKRIFGSIGRLEHHIRSESTCNKERICDKCGKKFKSHAAIQDHMRGVHGEQDNNSNCTVCGKKFKNARRAKVHYNKMHKYKLPCEHCNQQFSNNEMLKNHIRSVHLANDEKPFICEVCGKGFGRSNSYKEHCRLHTSDKPFKCRFCEYACGNNSNLIKHEKLVHKDIYTPKSKKNVPKENQ